METGAQPRKTIPSTQQLIDQILDFVQHPNTDYALMINGPWGCGKTYFVKNVLMPALSGKANLTYVSLHGVKSFRELDVRMLLGRIHLANKLSDGAKDLIASAPSLAENSSLLVRFALRHAPECFTRVKERFLRWCLRKSPKPELPELIVADDLERISGELSVEDVLGYFCTHLISVGKHVLFVCDETQPKLSDENYRTTREKHIRRVLPLPEMDDDLLSRLIASRCPDPNVAAAVQKIRPQIADFARLHGIKNLRTISVFIDGYSHLVRVLSDPEFFDKAGSAIVENLFPLYNEMALGKLSLEQLEDNAGLDNLDPHRYAAVLAERRSDGVGKESNGNKAYPAEFLERYETPVSRWEFRPEVFRFALVNEVDPEAFKRNFADVCREKTEAERALEAVRYYYFFDEDDLLSFVQTSLREMDAGNYHFKDLSDLSFCFCMIEKFTYLSDPEWTRGLDERMLAAVNRVPAPDSLKKAEEWYDEWIRSPFPESIAGTLQRTVLDRIKERVRSFLVSKRSETVTELFDSLQKRREPMDFYAKSRLSDSLLPDIVSAGMQKRVAELSTFGLRWMGNYIQRNFLDISSFGSPQDAILSAASEIGRAVKDRLSNGDLTAARRARLKEFDDRLAQLEKHLKPKSE